MKIQTLKTNQYLRRAFSLFVAATMMLLSGILPDCTAGQISVYFSNDDCYVYGTNADERLLVFVQDGRFGFYADPAHTTISGPGVTDQNATGYAYAIQKHDDIRFYGFGGDDEFTCAGLTGDGSNPDIWGELGDGDDYFHAWNFDVRYITMYGGNGEDEISLESIQASNGTVASFARDIYIDGQYDEDLLTVNRVEARSVVVGGGKDDDIISLDTVLTQQSINVNGWRGNDTITLTSCDAGTDIVARGYDGNDSIDCILNTAKNVQVNGEKDNDTLDFRNSVAETFRVLGGSGIDNISLGGVSFKSGDIMAGAGIDKVNVASCTGEFDLSISGGSDNDNISVEGNSIYDLAITGGYGSDYIKLRNNLINLDYVNGQSGYDTLQAPWGSGINASSIERYVYR